MMTAIKNLPPWFLLLLGMLFSSQMIDASELAIGSYSVSVSTTLSGGQF